MRELDLRVIVHIALLTTLITVAGAIKIPNLIYGLEFQLSAPLAIAICSVFGFKIYMISGCLSSFLGLVMGSQNIINVLIAMQFRLIVGLVLWIGQNHIWAIISAGPIASTIARLSLSLFLGKLGFALVVAALPGMIFTMIMAPFLVKIFRIIVYRANFTRAYKKCD